jgi:hypothetical protein
MKRVGVGVQLPHPPTSIRIGIITLINHYLLTLLPLLMMMTTLLLLMMALLQKRQQFKLY